MEFVLRCNELKCRSQLNDRAVVTTCSHIFCPNCADSTGLSRSSSGGRICPACQTQLTNHDDVVVSLLNPAEDYKTSVLSGLSPTVIMECASRGLAFYSYQTSQEVIYQEHLAKSLTEKYANLSQSMDQLIHDANAQIKALQEKLQAMHEEQASLEQKNQELVDAFRDKSRAHAQTHKQYQSLKAQVMATHVANAAGEDVDLALNSIRQGDRFIDKLPGIRSSAPNFAQPSVNQQRIGSRLHNRTGSGSSGSSGQRGVPSGLRFNNQLQTRIFGGRTITGQSTPVGTPQARAKHSHRSQLPVIGGGSRQNAMFDVNNVGPTNRVSPMARHSFGGSMDSGAMDFEASGGKPKRNGTNDAGYLRN